MRRTSIRLIGFLATGLVTASPTIFAQDYGQKPKSPTPDALPGQQLIVWTETQKPHPVPGSSDEMYPAAEQAQVLDGTILARGSDLFFAGQSGPAYRIDNKDQLRAFAGRKVRIVGNINAEANSISVLRIKQQ
jgi:hypothetical protein